MTITEEQRQENRERRAAQEASRRERLESLGQRYGIVHGLQGLIDHRDDANEPWNARHAANMALDHALTEGADPILLVMALEIRAGFAAVAAALQNVGQFTPGQKVRIVHDDVRDGDGPIVEVLGVNAQSGYVFVLTSEDQESGKWEVEQFLPGDLRIVEESE
jgi:hypothetical protein